MSQLQRASPRAEQPAGPCTMVIFGANGDLTKRKLLPALLNLLRDGLLSDRFALIAVARTPATVEEFRDRLVREMQEFATSPVSPEEREWLCRRIAYVEGTFEDAGTYARLSTALEESAHAFSTGENVLYYLATPPQYFPVITTQLGEAGLARQRQDCWRRIIFEKPFGEDLESAVALNRLVGQVFDESQVYRIDHYLGKETVQNLMVFRFGNGIFEPIWNRRYVDHVQITVAEAVGVEERGGYYDRAGALRDMVPNHLFQLLALVAMEPPNSFNADAVRDERVKVLRSVRPLTREEIAQSVVRGQYDAGVMGGRAVPAYRHEAKVDLRSSTETFVALKLVLDSWRWADVPFYLRTGKRLPSRVSEIAVLFKRPPLVLFREVGVRSLEPNLLIVRIHPDEGISLRFSAKRPGPGVTLGTVNMDFKYRDYFGSTPSTGYETLLYDCMNGDATLFHRADMVEAGWAVVTPILDAWRDCEPPAFPNYASATWGPDEAVALMARDGRSWRKPHETAVGPRPPDAA